MNVIPTRRGRTVASMLGVLALGIIMGASAMADNGSLGGPDATQVVTEVPMVPGSTTGWSPVVVEPTVAPVVVAPKAAAAEPVRVAPLRSEASATENEALAADATERKAHTSRTAPEPVTEPQAAVVAPAAPAPAMLMPKTAYSPDGVQGEAGNAPIEPTS